MKHRATFGIILLASVLLLTAAIVWPRLAHRGSDSAGAVGGQFSLTDQTGRTVTDADFRGRLMIIYFGYTWCPDVCPTTLARISQALDALTETERRAVAPIFITVDPERDTVARLAEYVAAFSPSLVGLTGSPSAIAAVTKEFHVYVQKTAETGGTYYVDHSSIIFVMDRDGHFRAALDPAATAPAMAAAIRKLL
jgi:protein SCO1/2